MAEGPTPPPPPSAVMEPTPSPSVPDYTQLPVPPPPTPFPPGQSPPPPPPGVTVFIERNASWTPPPIPMPTVPPKLQYSNTSRALTEQAVEILKTLRNINEAAGKSDQSRLGQLKVQFDAEFSNYRSFLNALDEAEKKINAEDARAIDRLRADIEGGMIKEGPRGMTATDFVARLQQSTKKEETERQNTSRQYKDFGTALENVSRQLESGNMQQIQSAVEGVMQIVASVPPIRDAIRAGVLSPIRTPGFELLLALAALAMAGLLRRRFAG